MELVWTVNSMLSWGCNYVMQWNLGWSVANNKKKTAAHTSGTCLCWLTYVTLYAESVLQCKRQFARHGQISECHTFAPPNAAPCTLPPGVDAPLPPPLHEMMTMSLCSRNVRWWQWCRCAGCVKERRGVLSFHPTLDTAIEERRQKYPVRRLIWVKTEQWLAKVTKKLPTVGLPHCCSCVLS